MWTCNVIIFIFSENVKEKRNVVCFLIYGKTRTLAGRAFIIIMIILLYYYIDIRI